MGTAARRKKNVIKSGKDPQLPVLRKIYVTR